MSNRRRITRRPQGYAVRVQRRSPTGPPRRPGRWWPRPAVWLPAALAVAAETGHLAAAYLEWPGSAAAGGYHVAAGALLGLVAAAVAFGGAGRVLLAVGAAVASSGPMWWLGGTLLDASPYHQLPAPAAVGIAVCEAALAALLLPAAWQASRRWSPAGGARPGPLAAGTRGRPA